MIRIQNIRVPLDYTDEQLQHIIGRKLHIPLNQIKFVQLRKKSVDARKKDNITFLLTVDVKADNENKILRVLSKDKDIAKATNPKYQVRICHTEQRPVVVGFGPAGMFASYVLAKAGMRPIILERGCPVEERMQHVRNFRENGVLLPESNIQFGEGGAGTFSDGKLNTGIKDARIRFVLETFVQFGAPKEILYQSKPHIGTDNLTSVVKNLREMLKVMGAEIHFHAKMTGFTTKDNALTSIQYVENDKPCEIPTNYAIFALGHSARDTMEQLHKSAFPLAQKPFSMGVRIEHLQADINRALYGKFALNLDYSRAAAISHVSMEAIKQGLTVNLTDRTVTDFFKKKYLLRDIHLSIPAGHMVLLLWVRCRQDYLFLNAVTGYEKG